MNFKNSKFIVLEGIDGSGKTQACKLIAKILKKHNIKYIIVREPGGTPISEKIRKIIKHINLYEILNNKTILLLVYASRMQLIQNIIKPALKNNIWIISDRYDLSSFAYQGGGYKINNNIIQYLKNIIVNSYNPDLTIYLDVIPKNALKRIIIRGKLDKIEKNNLSFFKRIRNIYLNLISKDINSLLINANLKIDIVHQDIKNKFTKWLKKCKQDGIHG
ncbi:dTMP kinase [Buchnera aphidicola]|uniref:Thymidylate kinase n=1 Tax=Buchnera aphidicola (Therioaphis trifolii) TaxID=1241884 RepID=A0A4D6YDT2_9GAMM|nr:dTMP kinase [Buchnera aphidicola]QCI27232.1 dTMP kinase [Buchnera aphidicola (Therioaphis trifolii)]